MKEKKEIELLAPGGDIEAIIAAITAGADAIYCGLDRFNARNRAVNITLDSLKSLLRFAHQKACKIFLTLNILILQREFPSLFTLLNKLVNTTIDGVIVQDIGLFYLLKEQFPRLSIHASTQCTTHNESQLLFLKKLGAERVNLCRELSLREIATLTQKAHSNNMEVEVFVHGSNCISISGLCYMSSHQSGNSGNRGRCSQPCRDAYEKTDKGVTYPLNLKDKTAWQELSELAEIGVDSLKIEGRIKKYHYVYTVVESWRKHLDHFQNSASFPAEKEPLYTVFNRDLSNDYLKGSISSAHFIDNPRDNAALHRAKESGTLSEYSINAAKKAIYDVRTKIIGKVDNAIASIDISPFSLHLAFTGKEGEPLKLSLRREEEGWEIATRMTLQKSTRKSNTLHSGLFLSRFKQLTELGCTIESCDTKGLETNLTIPFRELTELKKKALSLLNENREYLPPVELPLPCLHSEAPKSPQVTVLISDMDQIDELPEEVSIYLALPGIFPEDVTPLLQFFRENPRCTPWFPAMLIGRSFSNAREFLQELAPVEIITENSGIAYEASQNSISWIAGPQFNCVNSYCFEALKKEFNCKGAFISNELNSRQVGALSAPTDFKLHYSLFHPSLLMTSRQCFFHQTTGCHKSVIDGTCLSSCNRTSTIKDLKERQYILEKSPGNYHRLFAKEHYFNSDIVSEHRTKFDSFLLDFRQITTETQCKMPLSEIIRQTEQMLKGNVSATEELHEMLKPTENRQYQKGL